MIYKKIDTSHLSEEQKEMIKEALHGKSEKNKKIKELVLKKDRVGLEAMGIFLPETFYHKS